MQLVFCVTGMHWEKTSPITITTTQTKLPQCIGRKYRIVIYNLFIYKPVNMNVLQLCN